MTSGFKEVWAELKRNFWAVQKGNMAVHLGT